MSTFAEAHSAESVARTQAGQLPRPRHPARVAPPGGHLLQGKAHCACGGGCPRCQGEQTLQPKLRVSRAGDALEQEADRVAEQVLGTAPSNDAGAARPAEGSSLRIARYASGACARGVPPLVHDVLRSAGEPLDPRTRDFMELRFGYDFGGVRVHTDARAAESARAVDALAYTVGSDIVFGAGQYAPETGAGRKLLAHELTHTVQQRAGAARAAPEALELGRPADKTERGAEAAAATAAGGRSFALTTGTGIRLARQHADDAEQARRRQAEVEFAVSQMSSVLSGINVVGAEVEFLFWTSNGAITLVSFRRTQQGSTPVRPFTEAVLREFAAGELRNLPTFVGTAERYVTLTMRRTQSGWEERSFRGGTPQGAPARPPEGRTIPLARSGYSVETFGRAGDVAAEIARLLQAPRDGSAELAATLEFDDDRIVSWAPERYQASGGRAPAVPAERADIGFQISSLLLPLTSGLGRRTVRLVLRGRHSGGAAHSTWQVAEANVVRPAAPAVDEANEIVREYRRTHERIIAEWRQGVRDAAVYVGMIGLREAAFWVIGGVVFRGLGAGIGAVAPRLFSLLRPGNRAAAEYLETLIVRLLPAEKAELQALAAKAETEGLEALSAAQRSRLNALYQRLEQLISAPISDVEKGYLRTAMHGRYEAAHAAEVAAFDAAGRAYQVHHRLPLEYGHLFPGFDVNAAENLIGLDTAVHSRINAVWTRFRTLPANRITPDSVRRVAEIIDRHFAQWYHSVPATQGLEASVEAAKDAARTEVDALIRVLNP